MPDQFFEKPILSSPYEYPRRYWELDESGRNLWEHIAKKMPKKGKGKAGKLDPLDLPMELQTAMEVLYGHYEETFEIWQRDGIRVPPCFIFVCNNTSTSKLVYDFVSGFEIEREDGSTQIQNGRFELFRNYDEHGNRIGAQNTLLIDSQQLEPGEALDKNFRDMASSEIERFRREMIERSGDPHAGEKIDDATLLREVMNTVGKHGRLGANIRCVVSVSMLTEGWDANTVTQLLGVRAFGTQLLCEQVIGRALRRQSYELNDENLFNVEYADILGIDLLNLVVEIKGYRGEDANKLEQEFAKMIESAGILEMETTE